MQVWTAHQQPAGTGLYNDRCLIDQKRYTLNRRASCDLQEAFAS